MQNIFQFILREMFTNDVARRKRDRTESCHIACSMRQAFFLLTSLPSLIRVKAFKRNASCVKIIFHALITWKTAAPAL